MRLPLLGAVTLLFGRSLAVFADEAWKTDYHHALLGLPQEDTTFLHQPSRASKASLIYTLSERGVIGAVNPRDGLVVWRQSLTLAAGELNATFLRAGEGQDVVISGGDGQIAAWSASDGRLVWSVALASQLKDLEILELSAGPESPDIKDPIVLTSGDHSAVQRLDALTGAHKWTFAVDTGDIPFQLSASATHVYAVLLHKTMLGNIKIKVVSLDPVTGKKVDEYTLGSDSELASAEHIISVGANSASPIIVWTDAARTVLKLNVIGTKGVDSFNIDKHGGNDVESVRVHAPYHVNSRAHFLVHYETATSHWAEVFHVDLNKGKIQKAYDLPNLAGRGAFSTSTINANVYFTRTTDREVITVSSVSHGILGRWEIKSFGTVSFPGDIIHPVHAVSEVSIKDDQVSALRSAVLLSSGDWVSLREGNAVWQRPEVLARTASAAFVLPSEAEALAHELDVEAHSNAVQAYLHRVQRHFVDLQKLPALLAALPGRIRSALVGTTAEGNTVADTFGFHQIIACATADGRVIALNAADPSRVLWNRKIATLEHGNAWDPRFTSTSDGVLVLTHGVHGREIRLNATNGNDIAKSESVGSVSAAGQIQFTLRDGELQATTSNSKDPLWRFQPSDSERIVGLTPRPVNDPVASIGKVLGDRRVLYKYLSPNLALLVTAQDQQSTALFYLLDTVSGSTLFSSSHIGVDLNAPITSIMSENWFAYSFTAESSNDSPKGHQLVVGEMFESLIPNDRGPLSTKANYSSLATDVEPFVLTKTYQIPEYISKLAVTQTRQGITSRQLLAVVSDSHAIVGIPYPVLDPRRPIGRDPTKDELAEGLMRYAPTIEFDPKWYLTHQREVIGIQDVLTSPALIESTSLVFAYGLDIFGTRLSPSFGFDMLGSDFNKFQMLATVAALAVATFVVAPLVARKQINTRWSFA